jgi:hypothetical protein
VIVLSQPQKRSGETYRDLVERAVWSKGEKPFDPEVWRTELFASDEELADFLDDIYAARQADPAT